MAKCAICGKEITAGYVWDGTDAFCSEECLGKVFDDPTTAEILIDEGDRVVYQENILSLQL